MAQNGTGMSYWIVSRRRRNQVGELALGQQLPNSGMRQILTDAGPDDHMAKTCILAGKGIVILYWIHPIVLAMCSIDYYRIRSLFCWLWQHTSRFRTHGLYQLTDGTRNNLCIFMTDERVLAIIKLCRRNFTMPCDPYPEYPTWDISMLATSYNIWTIRLIHSSSDKLYMVITLPDAINIPWPISPDGGYYRNYSFCLWDTYYVPVVWNLSVVLLPPFLYQMFRS